MSKIINTGPPYFLYSLLFLSIFLIPFFWVFNIYGTRVTTTVLLFSITLSVWLFDAVRFKRRIKLSPLVVPMALFMAACVLSSVTAQNKFIALRETLQFLWLFLVFHLIFNSTKDGKDKKNLLLLIIIGGVIISTVGLYQHYFISEPFHFRITENRLRAYATFGQPNAFGNYLIGLIPLSIGFYNFNDKNRWKIAFLACLFIISLSLFATFSRGSWIGLVIGIGTMLFIVRKHLAKKSLLLPVFTILLAAAFILGDIYLIRPEVIRLEVIHRFSNTQRFLLAKNALDMTIEHPFIGVGPGNYSVLLPQYAPKELMESAQMDYDPKEDKWLVNPNKKVDIEIVHNMFLQVSAETGLIGLTAFLWLLYAYYKTSLKLLKQCKLPKNIGEYFIRAGLIGSFTAIMASGLFGWPFSHGIQEILMLSMALSIAQTADE